MVRSTEILLLFYNKSGELSTFLTIFPQKLFGKRLYICGKNCYNTNGRVTEKCIHAPVAQLDRVTDSDVSGVSS